MSWEAKLFYLVAFWTGAYLAAIMQAARTGKHGIPAFSVALNFAWELVAIVYYREYVGIVWALADAVIVCYIIREYRDDKRRLLLYALSFAAFASVCAVFFEKEIWPGAKGFKVLGFIINLTMECDFLCELFFGKIEKNAMAVLVAVFKLLGDLVAWNMYGSDRYIFAIGLSVFVLNLLYLAFLSVKVAGGNGKAQTAGGGNKPAASGAGRKSTKAKKKKHS